MKDIGPIIGVCAIAILVTLSVILGIKDSHDRRTEKEAFLSQCEYMGSRIEKGFGSITIYRYKCGDQIEESRIRVTE